MSHFARRCRTLAIAAIVTSAAIAFAQSSTTMPMAKTFIDYFKPTPIVGVMSADAWGALNVLPRDASNGLEDPTIAKFCYWDGQILKGPDGRYHLFASRWDQSKGHGGWGGSIAVHAVSENPVGPYRDAGPMWPDDQNGKGHNVTALALADGTYAVVSARRAPATFSSRIRSTARGRSRERSRSRPASSRGSAARRT